jgi:hypothetical protein
MITLPAFYLHIEYYFKNRFDTFIFCNNTIIHKRKEREVQYNSDELQKIIVYMSTNKYKNSSLQYLPMESYSYTEIYVKNGEKIVITNLLIPALEKMLKSISGVPYERKKNSFAP